MEIHFNWNFECMYFVYQCINAMAMPIRNIDLWL